MNFARCPICIGVAVALLVGCGAAPIPQISHNDVTSASAYKHHKTFNYTGSEQKFVVPEGVTQVVISAHGGEGDGDYDFNDSSYPGRPGRILALVSVQPNATLYVFVGASGEHGGYNGGGQGGPYGGSPGGGASDVRAGGDRLSDRIVVAAGGGGAAFGGSSFTTGARGGYGGGLIGGHGGDGVWGGSGGRKQRGGAGGAGNHGGQPGAHGKPGVGGDGGVGAKATYKSYGVAGGGGGGGGGGYYGGGGGGGGGPTGSYYASNGGGGGGGSSYVEKSALKSQMWSGWHQTGDGRVIFSWN